jgi:hypothetical protein
LRGISNKVDQLSDKVDEHRQETKADHAALRSVVGGMSHTVADHEERIKALEGGAGDSRRLLPRNTSRRLTRSPAAGNRKTR